MTLPARSRTSLAECVIGLSICGAAYYLLVAPLRAQASSVRAELSARAAEPTVGDAATFDPQRLDSLTSSLRTHLEHLHRRGTPARDPTAMFTRVNDLAAKLGLRIHRVEGGEPKQPSAATAPPGPPASGLSDNQTKPKDTRATFSIELQARYADVPALLAALQDQVGIGVLRAVRITPSGESASEQLNVTVKLEAFAFDTSSIAAQLDPASASNKDPLP